MPSGEQSGVFLKEFALSVEEALLRLEQTRELFVMRPIASLLVSIHDEYVLERQAVAPAFALRGAFLHLRYDARQSCIRAVHARSVNGAAP